MVRLLENECVPDVILAYWSTVDMMQDNPGMYGFDKSREKLHKELCEWYKISKEDSKMVTDYMHLYETAIDAHFALKEVKEGIRDRFSFVIRTPQNRKKNQRASK